MKKNKHKNQSKTSWIIIISLLAFFISFIFSLVSELTLSNVNIIIGIIILIIFIVIGIIFDMIGVAVTSTTDSPLHAMSAKKIKGAKTAVSFKKNADKVSSFCNDVIGDICGIISGTVGVTIASTISKIYKLNIFWTGLVITSLIASLTIGGKAFFKSIAIKNSNQIVYYTAKVIAVFDRKK